MAAVGSAVGLGNIWRFPYMAGEYGGSSFILVYILCIFLIGLPILCCEFLLGRHSKRNTVNAFKRFHREYATPAWWQIIGWMGMAAGVLILSFYSVIGGWVIHYMLQAISDSFASAGKEAVGTMFTELIQNPASLIVWHTLFMILVIVTLSFGVRNGIERVAKYFMPLLLLLMLTLIAYNIKNGGMSETLSFMFEFDASQISAQTILVALGQAFFSLSIGMGAMMVYGSYLGGSRPLIGTTLTVVIADTSIAILSGLAIFPILFVMAIEPTQGPGLIFTALPLAIGQIPGSAIFGTAFFFLLLIAAWTSAISLLEPLIAWCIENLTWSRVFTCWVCGSVVWLLGLVTVFSFNEWAHIKFFGKTLFGLLDFLTSNIMLPLGGLLIIVFAGWVLPRAVMRKEVGIQNNFAYKIWQIVVRYVCPLAVLLIFIEGIFG